MMNNYKQRVGKFITKMIEKPAPIEDNVLMRQSLTQLSANNYQNSKQGWHGRYNSIKLNDQYQNHSLEEENMKSTGISYARMKGSAKSSIKVQNFSNCRNSIGSQGSNETDHLRMVQTITGQAGSSTTFDASLRNNKGMRFRAS